MIATNLVAKRSSSPVTACLAREGCAILTASHGAAFFERTRPPGGLNGGGEGRLNPRERHLSGRFSLRQLDDRSLHNDERRGLGVERMVFLGSSCIYPKFATQPIAALLTGSLEPTNEWHAIAKIAGLKLAEAYLRAIRVRFCLSNADRSLRSGRQFRFPNEPRDLGADPQGT
jgi:hypothetical protein